MQWKRRKVKRDYYHIIIKFPLKNISLQIEARSTFLWLNPSYILNSKSRNTVLLLKHGVWWVFSSKTLLDFKETLITLLVVRPKLEWASNYEMKEEGHLLQTKESRELLSWISSKEKFLSQKWQALVTQQYASASWWIKSNILVSHQTLCHRAMVVIQSDH